MTTHEASDPRLIAIEHQVKMIAKELERLGRFTVNHDRSIIVVPDGDIELLKFAVTLCPREKPYEFYRSEDELLGRIVHHGFSYNYGSIEILSTYYPMEAVDEARITITLK